MTPSDRLTKLLTWTAALSALVTLAVAVCMTFPLAWNGPGRVGALALFFPLHLLVVTLVSGEMALVARRRKARRAALGFVLVSLLTAVMALTPTVAIWQRAKESNVPLSVATYFAEALHMNSGDAQPDRSVVYGVAPDGTKLELDLWLTGLPNSGPPRPAVVMVHGGAWIHGNRSGMPDWNRWLNGLGCEVFDVEYRMPPPVRWLDEVGDVKSALGWIAAHAADHHVDAARISVMGNSAGANLALLAAYSSGDPRLPPSTDVRPVVVHSVINLYGPTDNLLLYRTSHSPGFVGPALEQYIGGNPDAFPERYRLLSPLAHVNSSSPPTISLLGTRDRLVATDQAMALDAALAKAGVPHETVLLPGNDHGFDVNWGGFATQIARARIKEFLQLHP